MTVAQAAADWLDTLRVKPHTVATYRSIVRHQLAEVNDLPVTRLWPIDIERLLREREREGYSGRTRRLILDVLRWTLRRCERDGIVERNVAELVDSPAIEAKEPVHFTAEEARRFLEAAKDDTLYSLYVVALATGLRRGELLALTWRDVDRNAGTIDVRRSKTTAGVRRIPMPPMVARVFGEMASKPGTIWPHSPSYVSKRVGVICRRAGLPRVGFHALRHSAASIMLAEGVPMEIVRQVLGHSRATTTAHYARAEDAMKREALEKLGRAIG